MKFFSHFYPQKYIRSAYEIPYDKLYKKGYRGIIFDIDNTLVEHGAPANEKAIGLFVNLHQLGFKTMVLSNNIEARVKPFADEVGCMYIHRAGKPKSKYYLMALDIMETKPANTFYVGDQLFTDIWGANRVGITSFLVKQIDKKEEIQIIIKRYLEKPILCFYKRMKSRVK